jgi:hypothetical protein
MDMAGGSRTTLPSTAGIGMSRAPHAGDYLSVFLQPNPGNLRTPAPYDEDLPDLAVQPVQSATSMVIVPARPAVGRQFQFTDTQACFRHDGDRTLTFTALEWDAGWTAPVCAGFYAVTLDYDATTGALTGAGEPVLLFTIPWRIWNTDAGLRHRLHCIHRFDWADESTVFWGRQGGTDPTRVIRTTVPPTPADYSTCSTVMTTEDSWGPISVNPSRTRVAYTTYDALYETDLDGSNRYVWVPVTYTGGNRSSKRYAPGGPCYADDNTLVYSYHLYDYGKMTSTWDIYRIVRGSSGVNLTGDFAGGLDTTDAAVR